MISLSSYVVAVKNTWSLLGSLLKHQVALHPIPKYLLCLGYIHSLSNCGHFENKQQMLGGTCAMLPLSSAYFSTPAATPGKFIPVNIRNNHSLLPNPKVLIVSILDTTPAHPVAREGGLRDSPKHAES